MKAIIMRGIPGSGKSTIAKKIVAFSEAVIVSADNFFMTENGYKFDVTKIREAHKTCFRLFREAVSSAKELVIVDNTNIQAWEISPYMMLAESFGYDVEIMDVSCDVQIASDRNIHDVPSKSVTNMAYRKDREKLPPWWKVTFCL